MNGTRIHSLDALRAFALLLGLVFHAGLAHFLPGGIWAIGTNSPSQIVGWFTFYTHSFRMELFFLLAGFFGAMAVEKRGVRAYLSDRARRIGLVFVLLIYPMKFILAALWMIAGQKTGWLVLPPEIAGAPWWKLAWGIITSDPFPGFQLTHLWFLYYLMLITGLFLLLRAVAIALQKEHPSMPNVARFMRHPLAPFALGMLVTPIIGSMDGPGIVTPDQTLAPNVPVLILYGALFGLGWWLFSHKELLSVFARRCHWLLGIGLVLSLPASVLVGMLFTPEALANPRPEIKWGSSLAIGLVMMTSVFGFIGLFSRHVTHPTAWVRKLADASYFIYLAHLPLIIGLQIATAHWRLPWWCDVPLVSVAGALLLMGVYSTFRQISRFERRA